jgi:hypothetical protein
MSEQTNESAHADTQKPPRRTTAARQNWKRSKCAVCRHPECWRIELLKCGGASLNALAEKFGVSRDSVDRHWRRHVTAEAKMSYLLGPSDMATIAEKAAVEGDSVIDYLKMCRTTLVAQLAAANEAGDARAAAFVVNSLTRTLEVMARVSGEVASIAGSLTINNTNVQILNHPQFATVQAAMLKALGPHPQARADVVAALRSLDAENAPRATARIPGAVSGAVIEHEAVA